MTIISTLFIPDCKGYSPRFFLRPFTFIMLSYVLLTTGCTGFSALSPRPAIIAAETNATRPQIVFNDNKVYQNNQAGIRIRGNAPIIIENCDVYQNGNAGINLNYSANVAIKNSNIYENKSSGISSDNGLRIQITKSRIHQNGKGGVRIRANEKAPPRPASVTVEGNSIFLNEQAGVFAIARTPFPTYLDVSDNRIYRNQQTGIRIEDNIQMTAANNEIFRNKTAGIALYINDELPPMFDAYQNKIYFNNGTGVFIHSGISGLVGVSNNLIYNNYRAGIACGLWGDLEGGKIDVQILHNTIVGNGSAEEGAGIKNDSNGHVLIKNNIIAFNFTTGMDVDSCSGYSYNLLFANGETSNTSEKSIAYPSFLTDKVQYAGCREKQKGDVLAEPGFANPDRYDFSLLPGSEAIKAAAPIDSLYFQNTPRRNLGAHFIKTPPLAFIPPLP